MQEVDDVVKVSTFSAGDNGFKNEWERLSTLGHSGRGRPGFSPEFPVRRPFQDETTDHQRTHDRPI